MAARIQVLLRRPLVPGSLEEYHDPVDITDDLDGRVETIRQRVDKNEWRYGVLVKDDVKLNLHSQFGKYFRRHHNSLFVDGDRENARVDILYDGNNLFTGFVDERHCRDDIINKKVILHTSGRVGLLQRRPVRASELFPGESFRNTVASLIRPTDEVVNAIGEIEDSEELDNFSAEPFILRSTNVLTARSNLLEAVGALLNCVDGAAVETHTGLKIVRREAQTVAGGTVDLPQSSVVVDEGLTSERTLVSYVLDDRVLLRRANTVVNPSRLSPVITILVGGVRLTRELDVAVDALGASPSRQIDARWLSEGGILGSGFSAATDISNFLFSRFRQPESDVALSLDGIFNFNMLDSIDLRLDPKVSGVASPVRWGGGVRWGDSNFVLPNADEVGIVTRGYVVDQRIDLVREQTEVVVRFSS